MPSCDQVVHRLERLVVDAADDLVEGVVDRAVARRPWRARRRGRRCTRSPVRCTAKSTIVVVPPQAAARVPVSKVSEANVPPKAAPCGCGASTPPGMTYLPVASIDAVGARRPVAAACAGREQRGDRLAVDQHVRRHGARSAVTTVPPVISVRGHARSALGDQVAVGVGAAVAVERPPVAHLARCRSRSRSRTTSSGLSASADVADELALAGRRSSVVP